MPLRSGPPRGHTPSTRHPVGPPGGEPGLTNPARPGRAPAPAPHPPPERRSAPEWREALVRRVRAEFFEMPGMHLSLVQAQRLFGLPGDICQRVLAELMHEGFLCLSRNGMFVRREFSRG